MTPSIDNRDPQGAGRPKPRTRAAKAGPPSAAPQGATAKRARAARPAGDDATSTTRTTHRDVQIDHDVLEFIEALNSYKHEHGTPFPGWSEVLHVLRSLGYRKPKAT